MELNVSDFPSRGDQLSPQIVKFRELRKGKIESFIGVSIADNQERDALDFNKKILELLFLLNVHKKTNMRAPIS